VARPQIKPRRCAGSPLGMPGEVF